VIELPLELNFPVCKKEFKPDPGGSTRKHLIFFFFFFRFFFNTYDLARVCKPSPKNFS